MSRLVFALSLLLSFLVTTATGKSFGYSETLEPSPQNAMPRKEKLTHLHFFWHDIFTGPNPSAIVIVPSQSNSSTFFGLVTMIDDALTMWPDLSSGVIERAQGLYAGASQEGIAVLMAMNLFFTNGEYKGSTLTVLGRNSTDVKVREKPVIGGTCSFRFARGYVHLRTYQYDPKPRSAVVEYDVYVWH